MTKELRHGFAVASPKVTEKMRVFLTADSLNAIVAEVIGVALKDTEGINDFVKPNSDDRQEFFNSVMLRMLMPVGSHANFVLTNVQHPAVEVIEHFRKHDILIGRHFPPLDNYIRVSLGTPEEMRAFWQVWDMLPWAKKFLHH
jgi:histidinol-phosphate aminotransferase